MKLSLITNRYMMDSITASPIMLVSEFKRFTERYGIVALKGNSFKARTLLYSSTKTISMEALPIHPSKVLSFLFITYTNQRRNLPKNAVAQLNRGKI